MHTNNRYKLQLLAGSNPLTRIASRQFDKFIDAEGFTAPSGIDIVGRQEAVDCIAFAR